MLKGPSGPGMPAKLLTIGWTAFDLFDIDSTGKLRLNSGMKKLPVKAPPMPDMTKEIPALPASNEGTIRTFVRIVHREDVDQARKFAIDPDITAGSYQYPTQTVLQTTAPPPQPVVHQPQIRAPVVQPVVVPPRSTPTPPVEEERRPSRRLSHVPLAPSPCPSDPQSIASEKAPEPGQEEERRESVACDLSDQVRMM